MGVLQPTAASDWQRIILLSPSKTSDTTLIKDFRKVKKLNYMEAQNAKENQRLALERKISAYSSDLTGHTNLCLR